MSFPSTTFIIILSLLVFTFLICASVTITLRQIFTLQKSVSTQRSIYKKRAIQALELAFVLYSILFFASAIDITFTQVFFTSLDDGVYNIIVFLPIFLSFSLFLVRYWFRALKKSETNTVSWFWALVSAFTSLKSIGLILISTYFTLYCAPPIGPQLPLFEIDKTSALAPYIEFFSNVVINIYMPMLAYPLQCFYMTVFFIVSGLALGYAFQIFYTLICRDNDDFGRDYYNTSIKDYSRNAYNSIALLCALVLIGIVGNIIPFARNTNAILIVLFPIVLVFYFLIMRSENPLRNKVSIAVSPLFLLIASVFFVLQTLY